MNYNYVTVYTMVCPPVLGDNPQALALAPVLEIIHEL